MTPPNPDFERMVRESFASQSMMRTLGATLVEVSPGHCIIRSSIPEGARQQHGVGHAGLTFSIGDSAAGYAALSVLPAGVEVMTVELKINLLAPASGRLVATGRVLKPGRRLIVVAAHPEVPPHHVDRTRIQGPDCLAAGDGSDHRAVSLGQPSSAGHALHRAHVLHGEIIRRIKAIFRKTKNYEVT